ncbi:MAG: PepSY domain-containing protein [Opitutales bacterium]
MNRQSIMMLHSLLAAFTLPAALMFLVTGALYTWGSKGSYKSEIHEIALEEPISADFDLLLALTQAELDARKVSSPEGKPKVKTYGSHFLLEWTGSSKDVILEPTNDPQVAKLTVKDTSWYRAFVQLHKAKGGNIFKVYAAFFALTLAALLLSGFIMAWQMPRLRSATMVATALGLATFFVVVWLS